MENNTITFTHNWNNKLGNEVFTTVRIQNPKKYKLNNLYSIQLRKGLNKPPDDLGKAKIILIQDFLLNKVSEGIALIDTALPKDKFIELVKTMYKNTGIDFNIKPLSLIFLKFEE